MNIRILALLLPCMQLCCATAFAEEPAWLACRSEAPDKQLDCYQRMTERYLAARKPENSAKAANEVEPVARPDWKLDRLWPLPTELPATPRLANTFLQHKRNYLLLDSIHAPASAPDSPNPLNRVPAGKLPRSSELKFQISLKAQIPIAWPWGDTLWFAYTQQSQWQALDGGVSRPFRETNYEPELIFLSRRLDDSLPKLGPFTPRFINFSYLHQSNGQSLPRSRSWNRLTAQLGSEYLLQSANTEENREERRLAVLIRPWWRIPENDNRDDNPDITKYLGHGDIEIDYWRGRDLISATLRRHALQIEWSFPLSEDINALNLHLQYFNGYGASLIDYNHKLHSFGVGLSLPY